MSSNPPYPTNLNAPPVAPPDYNTPSYVMNPANILPPQNPQFKTVNPTFPEIPQTNLQPQSQIGGAARTVIITQPQNFGSDAVQSLCPTCNQLVFTKVSYQPGALSWLSCALICLLGGWMGCFIIPFFVTSCLDAKHNCPNCGRVLGRYSHL